MRIDAVELDEAVDLVLDPDGPRTVHLCNAYTISLAAGDDEYRDVLNADALNLPDGMPLAWLARRLGLELPTRVPGPELMAACLDRSRERGVRHYFYGSTGAILDTLVERTLARWPGVTIAGVESPPFADLDDLELASAAARMREVEADVVWVGLGTPKQDHAVHRLAALGGSTYVAVGAAFDFLAGTKRRAPVWMQHAGLEWLFRLLSEPQRLWKRYLIGNTRFVVEALRDRRVLSGGVACSTDAFARSRAERCE